MSWTTWVLIAVAGGLGASARFLVDAWVTARVSSTERITVPVGTVVVNVSACFLIGVLTGLGTHISAVAAVAPVLGTGFLGGYSTFSTASVEGARLLLAGRAVAGAAHTVGMIVASLAAGMLGILLGRM
jgi:camphor resistance protein CrcB